MTAFSCVINLSFFDADDGSAQARRPARAAGSPGI